MTRALCTSFLLMTIACDSPDASKAPAKTEPAKADAKTDVKPVDPHGNPHAISPAAPTGTKTGPINPTQVTVSGATRAEEIAGLSLSVPGEWKRNPGSNSMRLAEFVLPGPGGEVTLVVSRFAGGGGDATANVERWKTQFTRADGSDIGDAAKLSVVDKAPLKITTVDLEGTNIAPITPGAPERYNEPNSRLLGAIVEGAGDPYFFKAAGSAQTLALWEPGFRAMVDSLSAGAAATPATPTPATPAKKPPAPTPAK